MDVKLRRDQKFETWIGNLMWLLPNWEWLFLIPKQQIQSPKLRIPSPKRLICNLKTIVLESETILPESEPAVSESETADLGFTFPMGT